MNRSSLNHQGEEDALRQVPKWADRYARNRVLIVLAALFIALLGAGVFAGLSAGAAVAWRRGHTALAVTLLALDVAFCVWWGWLVLTRRFGKLGLVINRWLYHHEGEAAPTADAAKQTRLDKVVAWGFFAAICLTPIVCDVVRLPGRYLLPLTAAYMVPLAVYVSRRFVSPLMLLWPAMYALHAILVLAGVPLLLARVPPIINVMLPMVGYQLVALLVAHLYSRHALRRLRALTRAAGGEGGVADGDD